MKTLKFMLAAATAIGLASATQAAVDQYASTSFETLARETIVTTGVKDHGNVQEGSYFYFGGTEGDNESVIAEGTPGIDRPRGAVDNSRTNILQVSTGTDPLLRTYLPIGNEGPQDVTLQQDMYVDTLVQFTVTPYTDTVTPGAADKLMVYLKESTNDVGTVTGTNLVVVGRYFDQAAEGEKYVTKEYVASTPVNPGQWYRLTVKAIKNLAGPSFASLGHSYPAFKVYIDNEPCTFDGPTIASGSSTAFFVGGEEFSSIGNNQVVLSLLADGQSAATLQGVGFAGEGKVDDIVFNDSDPFFTPVDFTFTGVSGVTSANEDGTDNWTFTAPEGTVIGSFLVNGETPADFTVGASSYSWTATSADAGAVVVAAATKQLTAAAHPWYENPAAVVLLEDLPQETGNNIVSLFHGQGQEEYLGLTFGTRIIGFNLYTVDGLDTPTLVQSVTYGTGEHQLQGDLRGVAISKSLGIALVGNYYPMSDSSNPSAIYAFPLNYGGTPTTVSLPNTYSFDSAAFSPDGKYLFSNAGNGDTSNQYYVKWSVSATNGVELTKVGSISAGGRGRNMAYGRINGRDLVFAMADAGKVVVLDMTGDDASAWTATDMITDLGTHSYGSCCVSGINAAGATPTLTVAASCNGAGRTNDVLNVYTLTVPASGTVTASLEKSFNVTDLTAIGFGENTNGHGNTVYVTDDNKTIYYGRNDRKLYAAQFAVARVGDALYESFKDAVDAAAEGDTVTVVGNCNVTEPVTFTKGITVSNDYTVTVANNGSITYAYRVINGTTTPVTLCGNGTFTESGSPNGSQFLVGFTKTRYETAATAGSLVLNGCTVTNGQSNVIKVENGTVTINGGTIDAAGLRAVKADGEDGANSATVTINGGTINSTKAAVAVSSKAGGGAATATITGGTIAGPVTDESTDVDLSSITIPGTSTARFLADQTSFCESGYETVLSDGWYVVQAAPSGEDIEPGQQSTTTYDSQAAAEAALANVTIVAADDIATNENISAANKDAYLAMFEKKVVSAGEGQYKVEVGLTAAATTALQAEVDADAAEVIEDLSESNVTLTTTPGFYYSFEYGTTLDNMAEGDRTLATGSTLTLPRPTTANATAGFYKVLVNVTDK